MSADDDNDRKARVFDEAMAWAVRVQSPEATADDWYKRAQLALHRFQQRALRQARKIIWRPMIKPRPCLPG